MMLTLQVKTVVIEELQVFGHKTVVKDLKVNFDLFKRQCYNERASLLA